MFLRVITYCIVGMFGKGKFANLAYDHNFGKLKSSKHHMHITVGHLFLTATNFVKRAKTLFCGNYFQGLMAATYMIMINSCIYVIFR